MVETSMQETLRNSSTEDLPNRNHYLEAKKEGNVRDPDTMAAVLLSMLHDTGIENGSVRRGSEYMDKS
jgi:hypothetical protein